MQLQYNGAVIAAIQLGKKCEAACVTMLTDNPGYILQHKTLYVSHPHWDQQHNRANCT